LRLLLFCNRFSLSTSYFWGGLRPPPTPPLLFNPYSFSIGSHNAEALGFQTQKVLPRPPALNAGGAAAKNTKPMGQDEAVRGQANMPRGQKNKVRGQANRPGVKKTRSGVKKTGCPSWGGMLSTGWAMRQDETFFLCLGNNSVGVTAI